jgi:fucose permease
MAAKCIFIRRKDFRMATLLLIIIYVCFIGLGLPDSLLGTAWPVMYVQLHLPVSFEAIENAVITMGTMVSSLNATKLIRKFGTFRITLASTLLTACAMIGYGFVPNIYCLLLLGIPMGIGAGAIDTALNNYLVLHYKASHMNWLHCFWGIGAMTGPLVMSVFIKRDLGWRYGYFTIGAVQTVIAIILLLSYPIWKRQKDSSTEEEPIVMKFFDLLKVKGIKLAMLTFLCYCATEYTVVCWASTYLVMYRGVSSSVAASWISMYYLGITAGRLLCGFIAIKIDNKKIITAGLSIILVGAVILMLPVPPLAALIGLAFVGFGCAPVFPGMLTETPKRFGKRLSQAAIGAQLTGAYTGILVLPMLFGFLATTISMALIPFFLAFLVITMLITTALLNRIKNPS